MELELYERIVNRQEPVAVIGMGYVGLAIAIAFSRKINVIGFDINRHKIENYRKGIDVTGDFGDAVIRNCSVEFTSDPEALKKARFFIIAVPTPVQKGNVPDLRHVENASRMVAQKLAKGAVVVYESTVYPGVTEEICIPILEAGSGLRCGDDFKVGYSPERVNPGDKIHRIENIVKIVSGIDGETLETVAKLYELIIEAGVYRAESIKIAEAAKVIENAQRDINIAFMNEVSMLFNDMGIDTKAVLQAAGTKWNFLHFTPGLVGGHCIGIDPFYLTHKAEAVGYHARLILEGRHINDGMGRYVARQVIKILVRLKHDIGNARVGILGFAYKADCRDIRNTRVIDIIRELNAYGVATAVADPVADREEVLMEYGIELSDITGMKGLNAVIVAVPHKLFREMSISDFERLYCGDQVKIMADIKGVFPETEYEKKGFYYWRL